jgi:sodium-dependent phosphate cotransporter
MRTSIISRGLKRAAFATLGLLLFILALWLLKRGAAGLEPLLASLHVNGPVRALGFGWSMAYLLMSGSPVAAMSLTLFGGKLLSGLETFAMITGSRLGASFIVLLVGFLYWLRGQQRAASVSAGILSFLVTATVYLPALALGYVILNLGWLERISLAPGGAIHSALDAAFDPIVDLLAQQLGWPDLALFGAGVLVLLAALNTFDRALPEIDSTSSQFNRVTELVYRPILMVLLGAGVTSMTLSVSVSLSLLVPLTAKGYIRRENIIPYIMGANITTFIDTLFAALLIQAQPGEPSAFVIVLTEIISVTIVSMLVLVQNYSLYQHTLERALEWILHDNRSLTAFVGLLFLIPLVLLVI